jgi:hypothetical protein
MQRSALLLPSAVAVFSWATNGRVCRLPHGLDRRFPFRAFQRQGKNARRNFSRFRPRNPEKSLDSDERNQVNLRKSYPLRSETATDQENPKRIDRTNVVARRPEGSRIDSIRKSAPSRLLKKGCPASL